MEPKVLEPARPGGRLERVLGGVSLGCLIALPLVMAIAHRSSPLVLFLAASFAAAAKLAAGGGGDGAANLGSAAGRALRSPIGVSALALLAWGAVSVAWSPLPSAAVAAWGEFVLPLAAGLVAALVLPARMTRTSLIWLAAMMILAAFVMILDLATGLAARRALGLRDAAFVLNRPALTLLVLLPGAVLVLWRERLAPLAALLVLVVATAILRSESGAAKLGLAAMIVAGGLALLRPRAAIMLAGAAVIASLALAPVAGELAHRVLPPSLYRTLAAAHAQERVDVWRSFGAVLRERPITGAGFAATARMREAAVAGRIAPDQAFLLGVGHPHNAPLQIWVELGAIGAGLAALVTALVTRAALASDRQAAAALVALAAAVLADSLVGQGAWQGWWPAGIAAALVWFRYDSRVRQQGSS